MAKRIFDIIASSLGLLILSPLFLMIAIAVKYNSPGPVIFKQERIGFKEKIFYIYKFRSMYHNADKTRVLTADIDNRITPVGKFIRKYKLDELPQLYNVLKGEMSIVGPRPPMKALEKHYPKHFKKVIFSVKPGLTDLAYLNFWNESEMISQAKNHEDFYFGHILPGKLRCKVYYAKKRTMLLDLKIIFLTLYSIIFRRN